MAWNLPQSTRILTRTTREIVRDWHREAGGSQGVTQWTPLQCQHGTSCGSIKTGITNSNMSLWCWDENDIKTYFTLLFCLISVLITLWCSFMDPASMWPRDVVWLDQNGHDKLKHNRWEQCLQLDSLRFIFTYGSVGCLSVDPSAMSLQNFLRLDLNVWNLSFNISCSFENDSFYRFYCISLRIATAIPRRHAKKVRQMVFEFQSFCIFVAFVYHTNEVLYKKNLHHSLTSGWTLYFVDLHNSFISINKVKLMIEWYWFTRINYVNVLLQEKKEEIWLSPMTKAPPPTGKPTRNVTTHKRHQKIRLHNDSGSTYGGQFG